MNEKDLYCMAMVMQTTYLLKEEHSHFCTHCKSEYKKDCFKMKGSVPVVQKGFYDMLKHLEAETGVYLGFDVL